MESLNGRLRLEIKKFVAWGRGRQLLNNSRERRDRIHNRFVLQVESPRSGESQKKEFLRLVYDVYDTSRMLSICATILGNWQLNPWPTGLQDRERTTGSCGNLGDNSHKKKIKRKMKAALATYVDVFGRKS